MNMSTDTPIHPIYSNNKMLDIADRFCDNRRYDMDKVYEIFWFVLPYPIC